MVTQTIAEEFHNKATNNSRQHENMDDDENEDTQKDKYLTFNIAHEDYGIDILYVTEIVGMQHISEIPEMPSFVKGVINLRGAVIPVMDVRLRFGMDARPYDEHTCVIVVRMTDTVVGLVVDTVKEVMSIPEGSITEPTKVANAKAARYIKGSGRIENNVKLLIDVEALLHEHNRAVFEAVATLSGV